MQRVARILITISDKDIVEYLESYPTLSEEEAFKAIGEDVDVLDFQRGEVILGVRLRFIEYEEKPTTDEDE